MSSGAHRTSYSWDDERFVGFWGHPTSFSWQDKGSRAHSASYSWQDMCLYDVRGPPNLLFLAEAAFVGLWGPPSILILESTSGYRALNPPSYSWQN